MCGAIFAQPLCFPLGGGDDEHRLPVMVVFVTLVLPWSADRCRGKVHYERSGNPTLENS